MSETFRVVNSQLDMVDQLAAVQQAAFPTLAAAERITAAHYAAHIRLFPDGQWAVLTAAGQVVACATDFRTSAIDFTHYEHRYLDAVAHNWLSHHDPQGEWLYGADIGVLPAYRRQGLATLLYQARRALVQRLHLRGHIAGGLLAGFGAYKTQLSAPAYVAKVIAGEILDPTLSVQLKRGFRVHGIIQHYVDDPACDGKAAFLVWDNPAYVPAAQERHPEKIIRPQQDSPQLESEP
jgi:GNAT superfamily N-acetyltransferase